MSRLMNVLLPQIYVPTGRNFSILTFSNYGAKARYQLDARAFLNSAAVVRSPAGRFVR